MKTAPHVVPRVAGIVASVHARLGEQVAKGQLLAVIHSATVSDQRSELQTAQKRLVLAQTHSSGKSSFGKRRFRPSRTICRPARPCRRPKSP
jgi:cobalt-zinc-cadmium efflux system membrane fusion protein